MSIVTMWLLMSWAGGGNGSIITVPGLASKEACIALHEQMKAADPFARVNPHFWCIPYEGVK